MGIEGENRVTQVLKSRLDDGYYLVNDVLYINDRGNTENIDHVVLGPNGIFAIETKHYSGKVTCKGSYWQVPFPFGRSPSTQAKGNAYWVNKAIKASKVFETLKVWVEPIVVFSNPDVELEIIDPEVEVVTLDRLVNSITSYDDGYNFSPEQLELMGEGILKQASHAIKQSE
jgi:NIMA (never in mitosis gene a)-related kinase